MLQTKLFAFTHSLGLVHKELMIKSAQGVTTGPEYNKLEGDRDEKRWYAYKKREESRKTNDELYL